MRTDSNIINGNNDVSLKPFLRWAGGKRWFLKHLSDVVADFEFRNYHEPFLGSGAVYFFMSPKGRSYLSDLNPDLVETYNALQLDVNKVICELKKFENSERCYYDVRAKKFRNVFRKAARFIYLNQTSFNGVYRVNLDGVYNVPFGYRKNIPIDFENLRKVGSFLQGADINHGDFKDTIFQIRKGDLVFLDPPYTISHNNNGFIKYNQRLFSLEDQYSLSRFINNVKEIGAYYLLTNAAHKKVEEIFEKGDRKLSIARFSSIGGTNAIRGKFREVIFTNIPR